MCRQHFVSILSFFCARFFPFTHPWRRCEPSDRRTPCYCKPSAWGDVKHPKHTKKKKKRLHRVRFQCVCVCVRFLSVRESWWPAMLCIFHVSACWTREQIATACANFHTHNGVHTHTQITTRRRAREFLRRSRSIGLYACPIGQHCSHIHRYTSVVVRLLPNSKFARVRIHFVFALPIRTAFANVSRARHLVS